MHNIGGASGSERVRPDKAVNTTRSRHQSRQGRGCREFSGTMRIHVSSASSIKLPPELRKTKQEMVGSPGKSSRNNLELTIAVPLAGDGDGQSVRGLDINQLPAAEEELPLASVEDGEEDEEAENIHRPKKLRLSKEQTKLLEECFRHNHTLNPRQKEALASKLKLKIRQVEVWFQNRRARSKLKQTEMECEYLKRCFGSLSEENRRLQREVEELRAMRAAPPVPAGMLSPQQYSRLQPTPPSSSFIMCPRCERITTTACVGRPS